MKDWYTRHFDHPYPSDAEVEWLAQEGGVTPTQVKKWMANKRVRSYNTLSFNGAIHPRRLKRLQRQMALAGRGVGVSPRAASSGGPSPPPGLREVNLQRLREATLRQERHLMQLPLMARLAYL